jgi:predicted tellurium resistance membrane protein TerC
MPLVMALPVLFALIVYFAVSKKSSPTVKRAAVIALIIIGVSMIISAILIFREPAGVPGPGIDPLPELPVQPKTADPWYLAVFVMSVLLFLGFIIYVGRRERRKKETPAPAGRKP